MTKHEVPSTHERRKLASHDASQTAALSFIPPLIFFNLWICLMLKYRTTREKEFLGPQLEIRCDSMDMWSLHLSRMSSSTLEFKYFPPSLSKCHKYRGWANKWWGSQEYAPSRQYTMKSIYTSYTITKPNWICPDVAARVMLRMTFIMTSRIWAPAPANTSTSRSHRDASLCPVSVFIATGVAKKVEVHDDVKVNAQFSLSY